MNYASILCACYDLPLSFEISLKQKSNEEMVADLLLYTRKRNHIITFQELAKLIPFNIEEVLLLLDNNKNYEEAKFEELINGMELGLDYKQKCIVKALYQSWPEKDCPFATLTACTLLTYEILCLNYNFDVIIRVFKQKYSLLNSKKVKNLVVKMKSWKWKEIKTKNNYAFNVIKNYKWGNN